MTSPSRDQSLFPSKKQTTSEEATAMLVATVLNQLINESDQRIQGWDSYIGECKTIRQECKAIRQECKSLQQSFRSISQRVVALNAKIDEQTRQLEKETEEMRESNRLSRIELAKNWKIINALKRQYLPQNGALTTQHGTSTRPQRRRISVGIVDFRPPKPSPTQRKGIIEIVLRVLRSLLALVKAKLAARKARSAGVEIVKWAKKEVKQPPELRHALAC